MTFIRLLVYLHFAKSPFAARRLFEPHKETQDARIRAKVNSKKHGFDMFTCQTVLFELLCCFAAYLALPYSGASLLEAAKWTLRKVLDKL